MDLHNQALSLQGLADLKAAGSRPKVDRLGLLPRETRPRVAEPPPLKECLREVVIPPCRAVDRHLLPLIQAR